MQILTGGRQSGQNLYNALKLYNYIDSLQNDTTVRVVKKDGILALCVDKSISKEKVEDKVRELECYIQENSDDEGYFGNINTDVIYGQIEILEEILKESEE